MEAPPFSSLNLHYRLKVANQNRSRAILNLDPFSNASCFGIGTTNQGIEFQFPTIIYFPCRIKTFVDFESIEQPVPFRTFPPSSSSI